MNDLSSSEFKLEILRELERHFEKVDGVVLHGSVASEQSNLGSDIDLMVFQAEQPTVSVFRSETHQKFPLDIRVFSGATAMEKMDREREQCLVHVADGLCNGVVLKDDSIVQAVKNFAAKIMESGPPEFPSRRFLVSFDSLFSDLHYCNDSHERMILLYKAHENIARAYLWSNREWTSVKKHLIRRLRFLDLDFEHRLENALLHDFSVGGFRSLYEIASEIMRPWRTIRC